MKVTMTNQTTYPANSPAFRKIAPTVSLVAVSLSVLLMAALHILKPDLDPSWRMLSEYSLGAYGWVMKIAFWLLALSNIALAFALQPHAQNTAGKIGIGLHYLAGLSLIGAGLFDMDPITAKPEQFTAHGQLHGLTAMIGIPGQVLAALALAWGCTRPRQIFEGSAKPLLLAAIFTLIALSSMFVYLAIAVPAHGGFGPAVIAGWFNRLVVIAFATWLITAAWHARHLASAR